MAERIAVAAAPQEAAADVLEDAELVEDRGDLKAARQTEPVDAVRRQPVQSCRVQPYLEALCERGILALPAGPNVLRLLPPLVITEEQLKHALDVIEELLIHQLHPKTQNASTAGNSLPEDVETRFIASAANASAIKTATTKATTVETTTKASATPAVVSCPTSVS